MVVRLLLAAGLRSGGGKAGSRLIPTFDINFFAVLENAGSLCWRQADLGLGCFASLYNLKRGIVSTF